MPLLHSPLLITVLPAFWFAAYWGIWHFWLPQLLFPISLLGLAVPLCFGFAAAVLNQSKHSDAPQTTSSVAAALSSLIAVLAYGACLYGTGAVFGLVPEKYKFGGNAAYLSISTVRIWGVVTAGGLFLALILRKLQPVNSLGSRLANASAGMFAAGALFLVPLLLSPRVLFRA